MGSPEKPIDVEMADMDETNRLNPEVDVKGDDQGKEKRFTGLKKEELLEVSSQRSWVISRWILFILFWIVWIAMLVGAIVIVVVAPRCKEEPSPPWYQDTTIYEADVEKFGGNLNGVAKHLDYIAHLNSKTLVLVNAHNPDSWAEAKNESAFTEFITKVKELDADEDLKVVVHLPVDSLSKTSEEFVMSSNSSCESDPSGCSLFQWRPKSNDTSDGWTDDAAWRQQYKLNAAGTAAYLNYSGMAADEYLTKAIKKWIGYGVDGFQLGDFAMISSSTSVVQSVFAAFDETQADADDKKVLGLFLMSSDIAAQNTLFPEDKSQNTSAAVVINTGLYGLRDASEIRDAISLWRNQTEPFTCSYAFNTMDKDLLASTFGSDLAAGYTLLSYALPGVPYVRSGDEAVLTNDDITWVYDKEIKLERPDNASTLMLTVVGDIADYRVNKFRAMKSLRWDHNEDSTFDFIATNSTDVVAFARKWDIKPAALAFFNPTDDDIAVEVKDEKYKKGSVLGYSGSAMDGDNANVDFVKGFKLKRGSSMILSDKTEK